MKKAIIILICLLVVAGLMIALALTLVPEKINANGGFKRNYARSPIVTADTIDLTFDSYYIAGQTGHSLFLGNLVAPGQIICVNVFSGDTSHIIVSVDNPKKIALQSVKCRVDSPRFYLSDGTVPVIFEGDLTARIATQSDLPVPYFLDMEPMGIDRFAFRSLGADGIAKLVYVNRHEAFIAGILSKQVDGIFCTSGMMAYSKQRAELTYVHFYHNRILVMDTCLRIIRISHTIDTIAVAKISIGSTSDGSFSTFSKPAVLVNRQSSIFDKHLVVNSKILADAETSAHLSEGCNFDWYNMVDGSYLYTTYVPHYLGEEAKFHRLFDRRLAVLYKRQLLIYEMSLPEGTNKTLHVTRN